MRHELYVVSFAILAFLIFVFAVGFFLINQEFASFIQKNILLQKQVNDLKSSVCAPIVWGEHKLVLVKDDFWGDVYIRCLAHEKNLVALLPNGSTRVLGNSCFGKPILNQSDYNGTSDFVNNAQDNNHTT